MINWLDEVMENNPEITEGFRAAGKVGLAAAVLLILVLSVILAVCYKFAAKTHMLACGMKAASLWLDNNIE